jgi:hypothetical protein
LPAEFSVLYAFRTFAEATVYAKSQAIARKKTLTLRRDLQGWWEVCERVFLPINEFIQFARVCGFPFGGNEVGQLREVCLNMGLSPAGWRLLHRYGNKAFRAAVSPSVSADTSFANVMDYVEWQVQAGLISPLPEPLGERYLATTGLDLNSDRVADPRIARAAKNHWNALRKPGLQEEFAEKDWVEVLIWMRDHSPQFDDNQWRAGWPLIWRKYEEWKLLNTSKDQWCSEIEEFSSGAWHVVPLATSYEVAKEGIEMKHCVAGYAPLCRTGSYRLFSIRELKSGKRKATAGLILDGSKWQLEQVKAKCNDYPGDEIEQVAQELCARYNQVQVAKEEESRIFSGVPRRPVVPLFEL